MFRWGIYDELVEIIEKIDEFWHFYFIFNSNYDSFCGFSTWIETKIKTLHAVLFLDDWTFD